MTRPNVDYVKILYLMKSDSINIEGDFASNGWADGYADLDSNEEEIIRQLYNLIPLEELRVHVNDYLRGYEVGAEMSAECEEIYDEDGNLIENYDMDAFFNYYDEIDEKIKKMKNQKII